MNINDFNWVVRRYKKCPNCGTSYKGTDLQVSLANEIITFDCKCGWRKKVDKDNKEMK